MREFQFIDEVMPDVPAASPAQLAAARARVFGAAHETNAATVERARREGGLRRQGPGGHCGHGGHGGRRRHGLMAVLAAAAVVLVITITMVAVRKPGVESAVSPVQGVLGAAADRLAAQPPATGGYWRLETQEVILTKDGAKGFPVQERGNNVLVIGRDGRRYTWYEAVSAAPYGPAAERAWKKAGSPKLCPARGCDPNGRFYARHPLDQALKLADGLTPTLGELLALPREATALRARLLESYPAGSELSREQWLVGAGVKLVAQTPATPGTRAAGYRMLAALPGAGVIDEAGDVLGRQGLIVQFPPARGDVATQLVIDKQSGQALAVQQVAPHPSLSEKTVWLATIIKRPYWTDVRPVVPPGCRAGCTY